MSSAISFPALSEGDAHTLILGSMPGQASLQAVRYYAHPRNAFWPILLAIIEGQGPPDRDAALAIDYETRCHRLTAAGFALWDVLARCERPGSLDSRIVRSSEEPNDIAGFIEQQPRLQLIVCNGRAAETLLKRHCRSALDELQQRSGRRLQFITLPSTSPAMASLSLDEKYQRWAAGLLG